MMMNRDGGEGTTAKMGRGLGRSMVLVVSFMVALIDLGVEA